MAVYADCPIRVQAFTDQAVQCTFNEGLPEEITEWVPLSVIEDTSFLDIHKETGEEEFTILVKRWFLKKNDIAYEG